MAMDGLDLSDELESLRASAARFAAERLAPAARTAESAGRWPGDVLAVLESFSLRGLDLPARLGGDEAGCLAKVVLLETLAAGDAGGLPAADPAGMAAGALVHCPDPGMAGEIAAACLAGRAQCALVAADPELSAQPALAWAPQWPAPRWVFVRRASDCARSSSPGRSSRRGPWPSTRRVGARVRSPMRACSATGSSQRRSV